MYWSLTLCLIGLLSLCPAVRCCSPYEYPVKDGLCCPMCREGTVVIKNCTKESGINCGPCANGTFMDRPNGMDKCFRCSICDSGGGLLVLRPCTGSSNSVCGARAGFFCVSYSQESRGCEAAQRHSSCSPGQRVQHSGTNAVDTVCEDCPEGHFSPTGLNCTAWNVCSESQVVVRSGSSQEDVLCGGAASRSHFILSIPFVGVALILIPVLYKLKGRTNPKRHSDQTQNNAQI